MKKIPKKQFDEFLDMSRRLWEPGGSELIQERQDLVIALGEEIGVSWLAIMNLVDGLISYKGLNPDAENDEIYSVLRVSGWEVTDA